VADFYAATLAGNCDAIDTLLHDLSVLASDMNASTSRGYTRSKVVEIRSFRRPKA
jgi:hypothetical protein